jgi:uncharacterized protein YaaQ
MKLMIMITRDEDSDAVVQTLVQNQFRVTRMASTGGFLRRGNSTLLVGVEDEQVDQVIGLLRAARGVSPEASVEDDPNRITLFVANMPFYTKI